MMAVFFGAATRSGFRCAGLLLLAVALGACSQASEQDLLERAQRAMDDGNVRAAEIDVRAALQQNPDHAGGRRLLGEIQLFIQNPVVASEQFERSLQAEDNDEVRVLYARALMAAGRSDRLLALHGQNAFSSVSDDPRYQAVLASAQATEGELQNARDTLAQALAAAPEDPLVLTTNAVFLIAYSGRPEEARAAVQNAVDLHPEYVDAWSFLGGLQQMNGELSEAQTSYETAISLNPFRFPDRLNLITVLLDQGKSEEAGDALQRLLANNPDHPGVNFLHGRMLVEAGETEEALTALNNVLGVLPSHPGGLYLAAVANIAEGNLSTARSQLNRLLADQRDHVGGHLLMANLHLLMEDPAAAEQVARSILQSDSTNYAAMEMLVTALNAQGQGGSAESIELHQRLASARPDDVQSLWSLGAALLQAGDGTGGIAQFQAARDLAPESTLARERLIQAHMTSGDVDAARAEAEAYAQQHPDNPRPSIYLARLAMQQNDPQTARNHYGEAERRLRQALDAQPDNLELQGMMIDALVGQGKLDEAETMLLALPDEVARQPMVLQARGRIAMASNRPAEAEPLLRRAVEAEPNTLALLWLSGSLTAQGRDNDAIELLDEWLVEYPDDVMVHNELASTYLRLGREAEAREHYQEVMQRGAENVIVMNNLAWLLREDDTQQALSLIERAYELAPGSPHIMDTYAMVQLERGAVDEAMALNQSALELMPAAPEFLVHRAQILHAAGNRAEAIRVLEDLVGTDGVADAQRQEAQALLTEWQN